MADFDLTTVEQTAADTLPLFNGRPYNTDASSPAYNPYGFDNGGYLVHQMVQADMSRVMGLLARRMAILARADVALTHADVKLTAEDAKNTALDRVAAAQSVTAAADKVKDAAKEVEKAADEVQKAKDQVGYAKDEVQNAKAEAERARLLAQMFKLPEAVAADIGKWLKWNGSAWELGEITVATAAELSAGTGTGFVNSKTLGPILKAMQDTDSAIVDKLPPVGSYILRPFYAPLPGGNWLEPKGQVVSLASYPDLATALPVLLKQYGQANPVAQNSAFAVFDNQSDNLMNSRPYHVLFEGNRFACVQNNYVTFQDAANGKDFRVQVAAGGGRPLTSGHTQAIPAVIRDNNEIVYLRNGGAGTVHIDLNTIAGISAGEKYGNQGQVDNSGTADAYDGLYKLPNGTLINVAAHAAYQNREYKRIWKLAPGAAYNQWQSFDPISSTTMPRYFPHFQAKDGTVYALIRATSGGATHTLYKTLDGAFWTSLGTFTLITEGDVMTPFPRRREANFRFPCSVEQSADGQDIIVHIRYAGFLVSSDGGVYWSLKTANELLGITTAGYTSLGNSTQAIAFSWDAGTASWIFSALVRKNATGNQHYMTLWSGSKLSSLARTHEVTISGSGSSASDGIPGMEGFVHRTQKAATVYFDLAGQPRQLTIPLSTPATGATISGEGSLSFNGYLMGLPFDGAVLCLGYSGYNNLRWVPNDGTGVLDAAENSNIKPALFTVSADGLRAANITQASNNYQFVWVGTFFDFNPITERKLPVLSVPLLSGGVFGVSELYRSAATAPRILMRVK